MHRATRVAFALIAFAGMSCSHASNTAQPTTPAPQGGGTASAPAPRAAPPAPTTAAAPNPGGRAGGPPNGPPGGPPGFGGRGRAPMTPEMRAARRASLDTARAGEVAKLMARIAGKENASSQEVFQNLQLLQDTTAGNLVKLMDEYGRDLGVGCNFCHIVGKWEADSSEHKEVARRMIEITNAINYQQLTKLPAGRGGTPKITCMTCHRGYNSPNRNIMP